MGMILDLDMRVKNSFYGGIWIKNNVSNKKDVERW